MSKRWRKAILIIATLTLSATLLIWISQNDLSELKWLRPSTSIKEDLLTLIGGKSYEETKAILKENNFKVIGISDHHGCRSSSGETIGRKCIYTHLGGYRMFYVNTDVSAWLAFDQDDILLNVEMVKQKDSL